MKRLDPEFRYYKLQVQVAKKGSYVTSRSLVGKTIGTNFPHLATEHFANLEAEMERSRLDEMPNKVMTKVIELSESGEAVCALGVADAIVDLVSKNGQCLSHFETETFFLAFPIPILHYLGRFTQPRGDSSFEWRA